MKNIFILPIEPIETRYTAQWYTEIPNILGEEAIKSKTDVSIFTIDGIDIGGEVSPGAFLDFAGTNAYKASQLIEVSKLFKEGKVNAGDVFLITDFWNPTVFQIKYMSELLQIPVKLIGIAHAGSYDPQDFLGRLIGDAEWVRNIELGFQYTYDKIIFATEFHRNMFCRTFNIVNNATNHVVAGFPMAYLKELIEPFKQEKENIILFPHRIAPEKQHDIFLDLKERMPEYEFITCQDKKLSKDEYHALLGRSKILFSANLQETLGISSCAEGPLAGVIPFVPDRLSYSEIFKKYPEFMYPSEWTEDFSGYRIIEMCNSLELIIKNYDSYARQCEEYIRTSFKDYFHGEELAKTILED